MENGIETAIQEGIQQEIEWELERQCYDALYYWFMLLRSSEPEEQNKPF